MWVSVFITPPLSIGAVLAIWFFGSLGAAVLDEANALTPEEQVELDNRARTELVNYFTGDEQYGRSHRSYPVIKDGRSDRFAFNTAGLRNVIEACSIESGFYTSEYEWAAYRGPMLSNTYGRYGPKLEDQPEFMNCIRTISYVEVMDKAREARGGF
tara:strand:+ start:63 stop:530 length:468 start_codon:yes stop_codon:yes gene_type:complete